MFLTISFDTHNETAVVTLNLENTPYLVFFYRCMLNENLDQNSLQQTCIFALVDNHASLKRNTTCTRECKS
jgi:hypothetical protein